MASAIIVFSHLRWDFVYQRPQHLLSRLAKHHTVVIVEEPVHDESRTWMKTWSPLPNVLVCQPHTPVAMPGFHDDQLPHLQKLLRLLVRDYTEHMAWFYTPMALPLLQELDPQLVVYDCMDELASFKNAPKQLLQRESALLKVADIVFTGGPSLYRSKRDRHPNVHCFPSSVDRVHFEQALDRANSHPAHKDIPGPRLGFYGVIDERFDARLVEQLADAHPMWQIVLVGPVVKIDPSLLPQRANIHYLGQQPYEALPQFLAGWDVCLLPFALNESTRFISPTKTLEYMAAELPIVSTPVRDVADAYGDIVAIAAEPADFIAACEAALLATPEQHAEKVEKMRRVLAATSWDATADKMRALLENTPRRERDASVLAAPVDASLADAAPNVNRLPVHDNARFVRTAIIGAGPTGLSAAYHLGHDAVLLEKDEMVGGGCRSIRSEGFIFDRGGHVLGSNDPYVRELYELLLGSNLHWQNTEAWALCQGMYLRLPFHAGLHGLPPDVIKDCVLGAAEARYTVRIPETLDGVPAANVAALEKRGPANLEESIRAAWGTGIARYYELPYQRKLWGMPLEQMAPVPDALSAPDLEQVVAGALAPRAAGETARFGYPLRGGFQAVMSAFVPHIKGTVELNADVVAVSPRQRMLTLADGRRYQYDNLISTMPLPLLVQSMGEEAPPEVRSAAAALQHVSLRCVHLGVAREAVSDKHWICYPEDGVFHRVFMQGNASPDCNAAGGFGLTCEISYSSQWKPLPASGQDLIDMCIRDCVRLGLLRTDDRILTALESDLPYAAVLRDHAHARNVEIIKAWLEKCDIIAAGPFGEWGHGDADHAFMAGRKAAEAVRWLEQKSAVAAE